MNQVSEKSNGRIVVKEEIEPTGHFKVFLDGEEVQWFSKVGGGKQAQKEALSYARGLERGLGE